MCHHLRCTIRSLQGGPRSCGSAMQLHAAAALGVPRPGLEVEGAAGVAGGGAPKPCSVSFCKPLSSAVCLRNAPFWCMVAKDFEEHASGLLPTAHNALLPASLQRSRFPTWARRGRAAGSGRPSSLTTCLMTSSSQVRHPAC